MALKQRNGAGDLAGAEGITFWPMARAITARPTSAAAM